MNGSEFYIELLMFFACQGLGLSQYFKAQFMINNDEQRCRLHVGTVMKELGFLTWGTWWALGSSWAWRPWGARKGNS